MIVYTLTIIRKESPHTAGSEPLKDGSINYKVVLLNLYTRGDIHVFNVIVSIKAVILSLIIIRTIKIIVQFCQLS